MPKLNLTVRFNKPQSRAWRVIDRERPTIVLPWGRSVGKSWFIRTVWYLLIAKHDGNVRKNALEPFRGIRIICLMPTLKQFKDVHSAGLLAELEGDGKWAWLGAKIDKTTWTISFPGGSWIKPFPAAEHSSRTARGMRCDVISCDETDDIDPSVHDSVAIPWLSEPWSLGIEMAGGTPRRGRHGLLFKLHDAGLKGERLRNGEHVPGLDEEQAQEFQSIYSFHATYKDSPETAGEHAVRKARATSAPSVFRREWLCDFDSAEGLVYGDVFNEAFHVRDPEEGTVWSEILIGADHGWEDPGCLLLCGVIGHGRDATLWILDEIYRQHVSDSDWVELGRPWFVNNPLHKFYPDPSRPGLIEDYRRAGAHPCDVDNSIEDGVGAVADRLVIREDEDGNRWSRLYVSPRCVNTIAEFGKYRRKRDPKDADRYLDEIVDKDNHAMDPIRYIVLNRFGKPLSTRRTRSAEDYRDGG